MPPTACGFTRGCRCQRHCWKLDRDQWHRQSAAAAQPHLDGVEFDYGSDNTLGGIATGAANVISGNGGFGVEIFDSNGNVVAGDEIGTDLTGTAIVGNPCANGIEIQGSASVMIGGTVAGSANIISGNGYDGVQIAGFSANNVVAGNKIGTDVTGMLALGNAGNGIEIDFAADNTIGGATPASGNTIAQNHAAGVVVAGGGVAGVGADRQSDHCQSHLRQYGSGHRSG